MSAPVLNGPFCFADVPQFRAAEDATVDLSFHSRHLPTFGRCLFGVH